MATWKEFKNFIRANYELTSDTGDTFSMVFEFDDQRTQSVFIVKRKTDSGEIWIHILSPIGEIEPDEIDDALETAADWLCGGMVKLKSDPKYFMRHSMPIDTLSVSMFNSTLRIITHAADTLEERFVGGDEN
jgi:hypothetical protein